MGIFGSCIEQPTKSKGYNLFRPIKTNLFTLEINDLNEQFNILKNTLIEVEDIRVLIATNFSNMIEFTGSVVLDKPNLVSSIKCYRVLFAKEILKAGSSNEIVELARKGVTSFLFTIMPNFYNEKSDIIEYIKRCASIDMNIFLSSEKNVIIEFLICLNKYKAYIKDLLGLLKRQYQDVKASLDNYIYNNRRNDGADITKISEIEGKGKTNLSTAYKNFEIISKINDDIDILIKDFDEYNLIHYDDPDLINEIIEIAKESNRLGTEDRHRIVYDLFSEKKINNINNWRDNLVYREDQTEIGL